MLKQVAPTEYGLTRRQKDLLAFITSYYLEHGGVPPSYDEMKDGIGLRSKSGIHRLIHALVERGKLRFMPNRARTVEPVFDEMLSLRLPVELDFLVREVAARNRESMEAAVIRGLRERFFPNTADARC